VDGEVTGTPEPLICPHCSKPITVVETPTYRVQSLRNGKWETWYDEGCEATIHRDCEGELSCELLRELGIL